MNAEKFKALWEGFNADEIIGAYRELGMTYTPNDIFLRAGSDKTWKGGQEKSPFEVIEEILKSRPNESDKLVLPKARYDYIKKTPVSIFTPITIFDYLMDPLNGCGFKTVEVISEK